MPLTVQPINGDFAARVTGVRLGPDIGDDDVTGIVSAINRYAVLVFPGQLMSNEDQIAFSARIGPLETSRRVKNPNFVHRFDTRLTDVSNLDEEERMVARDSDRRMIAMSNRLWHTDSSFRQPLVRTIPGSGRRSLYLASHADHIIDLPLPEGRMLLHDLIEHATQPQFVHTHEWQVGDLVMWDDRCTMHRSRAYDVAQVRDMRRTTVSDAAA